MVSLGFMHLLVLIHLVFLLVRQRKMLPNFHGSFFRRIKAFGDLVRGVGLPSSETVAAFEEYICCLYCPKGSNIVNIPQCRWYLFSQKHAEGEKLPSTLVTLRQHISRAHFITMIWVDVPLQTFSIKIDC